MSCVSARAAAVLSIGVALALSTHTLHSQPPGPGSGKPAPWRLIGSLDEVPEVSLEPAVTGMSAEEHQKRITSLVARVRRLDSKKEQGFVHGLSSRRDLHGLPFRTESDPWIAASIEMSPKVREHFLREAIGIHRTLSPTRDVAGDLELSDPSPAMEHTARQMASVATPNRPRPGLPQNGHGVELKPPAALEARVRAAQQILFPEGEEGRLILVQQLQSIAHSSATPELVRLALFAPERLVRRAALLALEHRPTGSYDSGLIDGLQYPLPQVAENAADAIIHLSRVDLLAEVADRLEWSDPRYPRRGEGLSFVAAEVVKVNHHRNCLLCHPPSSADGRRNDSDGFAARIPNPAEPLPALTALSGWSLTPDSIRFDISHLTQDFSLKLPVKGADPWPELQRFDFVVRKRALTPAEVKAFGAAESLLPRSPYVNAAMRILRELTGKDAPPNTEAWMPIVKEAEARHREVLRNDGFTGLSFSGVHSVHRARPGVGQK